VTVFRYIACGNEDHTETGTVLAYDEKDAENKLKMMDFRKVTLKKVGGFHALWGRFTANVR